MTNMALYTEQFYRISKALVKWNQRMDIAEAIKNQKHARTSEFDSNLKAFAATRQGAAQYSHIRVDHCKSNPADHTAKLPLHCH